jgi:hypothetical protein
MERIEKDPRQVSTQLHFTTFRRTLLLPRPGCSRESSSHPRRFAPADRTRSIGKCSAFGMIRLAVAGFPALSPSRLTLVCPSRDRPDRPQVLLPSSSILPWSLRPTDAGGSSTGQNQ